MLVSEQDIKETIHKLEFPHDVREAVEAYVASYKKSIVPDHYDFVFGTQPISLDYKNRKHVYVFSNVTCTITSSDFNTTVPAGVWTLLDYRPTTRLNGSPVGNIVTFKATDELLPAFNSIGINGGTVQSSGTRTVLSNNSTATSFTSTNLAVGDLRELDIDIVFTSFSGGTTPTITYTVSRIDSFGNANVIWTGTALSTAGKQLLSIGNGMGTGTLTASSVGIGMSFGDLIQIAYTTTGAPASVVQSISVKGK